MANVTGRWALILLIFTSLPTLVTHIWDGAKLATVVFRTLIAAAGSLAIGFILEWTVHQIGEQNRRQSSHKGQHLDLQVGPEQDVAVIQETAGSGLEHSQ